MKKINLDNNTFYSSFVSFENPTVAQHKTTNINILLNRVRLDKKKDLRKRILLTSTLTLIISSLMILTIYF